MFNLFKFFNFFKGSEKPEEVKIINQTQRIMIIGGEVALPQSFIEQYNSYFSTLIQDETCSSYEVSKHLDTVEIQGKLQPEIRNPEVFDGLINFISGHTFDEFLCKAKIDHCKNEINDIKKQIGKAREQIRFYTNKHPVVYRRAVRSLECIISDLNIQFHQAQQDIGYSSKKFYLSEPGKKLLAEVQRLVEEFRQTDDYQIFFGEYIPNGLDVITYNNLIIKRRLSKARYLQSTGLEKNKEHIVNLIIEAIHAEIRIAEVSCYNTDRLVRHSSITINFSEWLTFTDQLSVELHRGLHKLICDDTKTHDIISTDIDNDTITIEFCF